MQNIIKEEFTIPLSGTKVDRSMLVLLHNIMKTFKKRHLPPYEKDMKNKQSILLKLNVCVCVCVCVGGNIY